MERTKYPRTMNLPWSGSESSDDVWWSDASAFGNKEVVVTEKLDGECTTIYSDGYVHARSVDSKHHPSRSWIKSLAAGICHKIPRGWRICGENLFAWHSIFYTELPTYFFIFGMFDTDDHAMPWREIEDIADNLGLPTVPVIWRGVWDEAYMSQKWEGKGEFPTFASKVDPSEKRPEFPEDFELCEAEGYVARVTGHFPQHDFSKYCAKYVRPKHVTTDQQWMQRAVIKNMLKS